MADILGLDFPSAEEAGEIVGSAAGALVSGIFTVIPEILEEVIPEVLEGIGKGLTATRQALRGKEVTLFAGLTVTVVSLSMWWYLKGTLTHRSM